MSARYDLEVVQGDTIDFTILIEGNTESVSQISFCIKKNYKDHSTIVIESHLTGSYSGTVGSITSLGDGLYRVIAPSSYGNGEGVAGDYVYSLRITIGTGSTAKKYTPIWGSLKILPTVVPA